MADLNPLIRVRKHAVEQKQKFLADLYRQAEKMAAEKQAMLDQLAKEREALRGNNSVEMVISLSSYTEAVKTRVKTLDEMMRELDKRIEFAREEMREAFSELKKIEITQERREAEELAEIEKKQAALLDDVALENFRRLKDAEA